MDISQILDPEEVNKLFHAKSEYGQLFYFRSEKYITIFRPLTVQESETLHALDGILNKCAIEDWVFKTTFVTGNYSADYFINKGPFMYVSNVASKIPALSNIQEEVEYKNTVMSLREDSTKIQDLVESIIIKGYMGFKDVKKLTQRKQLELLVRAEPMAGQMLDLGDKSRNKKNLRAFTEGATIIGGTQDITSREAADVPDFNETFE